MRFRLRTLLIVLAIGPMVLALPWIKPRLAVALLSFLPYTGFMYWQLRLRNAAKE